MPIARSALRPSRASSVGKPAVNPSTETPTIWVAPSCTPARSSSRASGTPSQRALPMRCPPTSLDTQAMVTSASTSSSASRSSKFRLSGRSTIPVMPMLQVVESSRGTISAVSMR